MSKAGSGYTLRMLAVSLFAAVPGCAVQPEAAPAGLTGPAEAAAQPVAACYPKAEPENGEPWYYGYLSESDCYRLGLCEGGAGEADGTGQCYKWAVAADAPALPWSERLTNAALGNSIAPPQDIYEGSYEMTSDSCFENCQPVPLRVVNETVLYAEPDARTPVVATLPAAECVGADKDKLLSVPQRGIIAETAYGFTAGDVFYNLAYSGEGGYLAWWRGDYTSGEYDMPKVQWDAPPAVPDPREGYWRELVRADGTRGWARDADITDYRNCTLSVN